MKNTIGNIYLKKKETLNSSTLKKNTKETVNTKDMQRERLSERAYERTRQWAHNISTLSQYICVSVTSGFALTVSLSNKQTDNDVQPTDISEW